MRTIIRPELYSGRIRTGVFATTDTSLAGAYFVRGPGGEQLKIIASTAKDARAEGFPGWEHVSVSCQWRCPNWEEMCFVKDLFWNEEECVAQFHPPKSQYVNYHPFCLHMWRNADAEFTLPPMIMVGPK